MEKKWNEELIKSQQWAKKFNDGLCKGSFSHIMPKARKTLGTTLIGSASGLVTSGASWYGSHHNHL